MTKKEQQAYDEALRRIKEAKKNNFTVLDLSGIGLSKLPDEIAELKQLMSLDLDQNKLTTLPEKIGELKQLKVLNLYNNQLTMIPEAIGELKQLQMLELDNNKLTTIPEAIGKLNLLSTLYLSDNQLTTIPEAIGELKQLQTLNLSNNQLTTIPEAIGELKQLRELSLPINQLTTIPEAIGELKQLQELYLFNNQLTMIPEAIGELKQLQTLYLDDNQIISLPDTIKNLKSLKKLFLHGNEELGLPPEVLGPKWEETLDGKTKPAKPKDILDYYFRTRGGKRPLNEAKLILVGRGAVGKTSLVNRLLSNKFKPVKKTEGIKISEWQLHLKKNETIRMNIWDFGGQEIMHATHQFFLTQRSLYLLVLTGREGVEDADAEYWLKLIASFGADSPIIIVMNKIEEQQFELNRRALKLKYPNIKAFVKTDCKKNIGIQELKKTIERETNKLKHLRDAFPLSWFNIKEKFAGMKDNFLSYQQFSEFCSKHGENDKAAQQQLANYLHTLGIALNYKDDPRLQDTHVLNPHWVTKGIYKIINSKKIAKQKGIVSTRDIETILKGKEYPPKMRIFLFDLMKKFDLCFSFSSKESQYLIPELLNKEESNRSKSFHPDTCLNFQYHYNIIPEGLLPRFIVRTHILSQRLPRWRTGVILQFEGCKALVKADIQDKKVTINISGGDGDTRRRLLAIIRFDFDRIHNEIDNLKPQEMVPLPMDYKVVVPYQKLLVFEKNSTQKFKEVVGDNEVELDVQVLLNGVDLKTTQPKDRMPRERNIIKLFYSYSSLDENLRNELETHLKILERQKLIAPWHFRRILAGEKVDKTISEHLEDANIILLLVSANYIASNYCYEIEMTRAIERHEQGEAVVIPVILKPVNWDKAPFRKIEALPKNGKPVLKWKLRDEAWCDISKGIEKVVEELRKKQRKLLW